VRLLILLALLLATPALGGGFDLRRDTFAFSNDTAFQYGVDERGKLHISRREEPAEFAHRCFVLVRGVMQFEQFARFVPAAPKLTREEYRARALRLFRIPVWSRRTERIEFPGFRDLRDFSLAYEGLLKETLGNWLPTYFRPGNYRMMMGHPRSGQAMVARWLTQSVAENRLRVLYLSRFPKMNHAVIVYDAKPQPNGDIHFLTYDCNYPGTPARLDYIAAERSFEFEKRWYFPGGRVNAMRVYLSPLH
jgi:hypothetical protein